MEAFPAPDRSPMLSPRLWIDVLLRTRSVQVDIAPDPEDAMLAFPVAIVVSNPLDHPVDAVLRLAGPLNVDAAKFVLASLQDLDLTDCDVTVPLTRTRGGDASVGCKGTGDGEAADDGVEDGGGCEHHDGCW